MKITASILFYALNKTLDGLSITWGKDHMALKTARLLEDREKADGNDLFIRGNCLFTAESGGSVCYADKSIGGGALFSAVLQTWNNILNWENRICNILLSQEPAETLFALGMEYLHPQYALIIRNFTSVLSTPATRKSSSFSFAPDESTLSLNEENINALLLDKHFHAAAELQDAFYYDSLPENYTCYCRNLFLKGQYMARFVMLLDDGEKKICPGEEQLFSVFFGYLQQYFQDKAEYLYHSPSDILQQVCHSLTEGSSVSPQLLERTLKQAGWETGHTYVTAELQFFEEKGWKTQLETTLPYLRHRLLREWPQSCIISGKDRLICIVNLSLSGQETGAFPSFCRKLALFVRENVCTAGVSSVFHDFLQLSCSAQQAAAALSIGRKETPGYWYYLYDHCRLSHILQTITEKLSPGVCLHPALMQLRHYDQEHTSELADTLKAYLDYGQNMSAAAAGLYIHRTTFCRRMDRICELTGIDLSDADTILLLRLSFLLEARN